ncbi:MAG: sel1 repeat family protein [Alphaproteobacteria bacterium]|nr:sel1 repeat family protein [Alphaproteobacteria bacterium]
MQKEQILKNMRRRAEEGEAEVQNDLAAMLATGSFDFTDETEARRWYTLAARQGYIASKWNLATMLLNGEGGPKDVGKAMFLIEQSAREGEVSACWFLRDMYRYGGRSSTEPDEAKALQWDELAEDFIARDIEKIPIFGDPLPDL